MSASAETLRPPVEPQVEISYEEVEEELQIGENIERMRRRSERILPPFGGPSILDLIQVKVVDGNLDGEKLVKEIAGQYGFDETVFVRSGPGKDYSNIDSRDRDACCLVITTVFPSQTIRNLVFIRVEETTEGKLSSRRWQVADTGPLVRVPFKAPWQKAP